MAYAVQHTQIGAFPYWYHLDSHKELQKAVHRARNYALDHGGYVCVKDENGRTVFGTDPVELDRAISNGTNSETRSQIELVEDGHLHQEIASGYRYKFTLSPSGQRLLDQTEGTT